MAGSRFSVKSFLLATFLHSTLLPQAHAAYPYCLPGDACFPSDNEIQNFNNTVNGRLIKSVPYGAACYKAAYDAETCKALAAVKEDVFYRQALPAGVMYTNWEQEGTAGCPVPDPPSNGSYPSPVEGDCTLGGMSAYVVNATSADDVAKAVKFAAKYNLRFRVKNSGHDYTGRSSGAGAFSVWTRYMNDAKLESGFKPCSSSLAQDVLSAGPGVNIEELFAWGGQNGVVTIGGFTTTVGATGGYVLGGGTGPLGPMFGMGVDNVVQYEVVTADGEEKIVNECTNQDLFWAMRGGGGTFAVVTRVYIRTYPAFKAVNTIAGQIACANYSAYSELIGRLVDLQLPMRNAGHTACEQLGIVLLSVLPFTNGTSQNPNETLKIMQPVLNVPGCQSGLRARQFTGKSSWNDAYQAVIWPIVRTGSRVGVNLADFSRLISYELINSEKRMKGAKEYILNLPHDVPFIWQNTVGEATKKISPDATSMHPDWRNAFAFVDVPTFGPWSGVTAAQLETAQAVLDNATAVFGTATYYNEDYILEKNWQESMFGSNYARLLEIKRTVDPNGLFNCRQCVGSENGY
ncbi:FAD-binding domain-containing protein [Zopfia rhizophila CBS 207.26]|uniref:FAD-binding domain-containing protein n=1 Tax=Zopfia rhizophila CBS 207.26 TaxID=1314779 RepID=A0A6A6DI73_9PEZI|nr:FAD-binding domain-containing protein [Zopfia rhizophila CBS 207.26]